MNFFVYLDKISISTLTKSFLLILDRLVNFNVCGITQISKLSFLILDIVNDTPLIKIDAFSTSSF